MDRMHRLIRNTKTGQFLAGIGASGRHLWIPDGERAWNFRSLAEAIAACEEHDLNGVEICCQFGEFPSRFDLCLPYSAGKGKGRRR